jgi:hypothetical protein
VLFSCTRVHLENSSHIPGAIAGVPGLEPRLNEPESLGLPITPYPTTIDALTPILEELRIAELLDSFAPWLSPMEKLQGRRDSRQ